MFRLRRTIDVRRVRIGLPVFPEKHWQVFELERPLRLRSRRGGCRRSSCSTPALLACHTKIGGRTSNQECQHRQWLEYIATYGPSLPLSSIARPLIHPPRNRVVQSRGAPPSPAASPASPASPSSAAGAVGAPVRHHVRRERHRPGRGHAAGGLGTAKARLDAAVVFPQIPLAEQSRCAPRSLSDSPAAS